MQKRVLVIGDAHTEPGQDLRRFKALKNFIKAEEPDYVVTIGDFTSMDALSEWDRNKRKKMENRRYKADINVANKALDIMDSTLFSDTDFIYLEGNHEFRLDRYLDQDPTFEGMHNIEQDLKLKERGIVYVPYKENYDISGVSFTHIPINGIGKPIGNPAVARKALSLYHNSVVFGHTHTLDHCAEHRQNAPHLNQALSVGCFFEHVEDYALGSKTDYWRGIVMLDIYHRNRFDFQTTSLSNLLKKHG